MKSMRFAQAFACAAAACVAAPTQARFLQVDPVGYDDQINLYAYVTNDPVNKVDPSGKVWLPPDNMDPRKDWATQMGRQMLGPDGKPSPPQQAPHSQVGGTARDFITNYRDMREAWTMGADKYFHCKANCESSSRGPIAEKVAEKISNAREITDQRLGGDPQSASQEDQRANLMGRQGGADARQSSPTLSVPRADAERMCRAACDSLRPKKLDEKW